MVRFIAFYALLFASRITGNANASSASVRNRILQGGQKTMFDIIDNDANLTTLASAFQEVFTGDFPCLLLGTCFSTVFAPLNTAFEKLDQNFLGKLLTPEWVLHLKTALNFHFGQPAPSGVLTSEIQNGDTFDMLNNETVTVGVIGTVYTLTSPNTVGSVIIEADILASNGVLHKIDTVLLPGFISRDLLSLLNEFPGFSIAADLVALAGQGTTIQNRGGAFTILAPSDTAWLALGNETLDALRNDRVWLETTLLNHVVLGVYPVELFVTGDTWSLASNQTVVVEQGTLPRSFTFNQTINLSRDIRDVLAINGIAHEIDGVLLAPRPATPSPTTTPSITVAPSAQPVLAAVRNPPNAPPPPSSAPITPIATRPMSQPPNAPITRPTVPITQPTAPTSPIASPPAAPVSSQPTTAAPASTPKGADKKRADKGMGMTMMMMMGIKGGKKKPKEAGEGKLMMLGNSTKTTAAPMMTKAPSSGAAMNKKAAHDNVFVRDTAST